MTITEEAPVEAPAPTKPAKRVKPAVVDLITAYCKNDALAMHSHCRGSGSNGAESTWFCQCDCHVEHPTCRDCGARDVDITLEGTCVDVEGCMTTQSVRTSASPVHQQLQRIISEAEQRDAAEKARKAAERAARRAIEVAQAEREGRPAPIVRHRVPRAVPTPQRCHCGCGGTTKGGKFVAGHDAKLKGILVKAARRSPTTVPGVIKQATKNQAVRAMAELIARNWPRKGVDAEVTRQADALFDQYGVALIESSVAARYGEG